MINFPCFSVLKHTKYHKLGEPTTSDPKCYYFEHHCWYKQSYAHKFLHICQARPGALLLTALMVKFIFGGAAKTAQFLFEFFLCFVYMNTQSDNFYITSSAIVHCLQFKNRLNCFRKPNRQYFNILGNVRAYEMSALGTCYILETIWNALISSLELQNLVFFTFQLCNIWRFKIIPTASLHNIFRNIR